VTIFVIATFLIALSALGGVFLGHFLTMKAISHIQPSTIEVVKAQKVNDEATKTLELWDTEQEKPEIPDSNTMSPHDFVDKLGDYLKVDKS
jgi:hypothetical protein